VFLPPIIAKRKILYCERLLPSIRALVWRSYILFSLEIIPKWSRSECDLALGLGVRIVVSSERMEVRSRMHSFFKLFGLRKHTICSLFRTFFMLLSPFVSFCQTLFIRLVFPVKPAPP
jgi:hypothetical protein